MGSVEEQASECWEGVKKNYESIRKERFGDALKWHHRSIGSALIAACVAFAMMVLAGIIGVKDIKHPLIIAVFVFIVLALIFSCIATSISRKYIDESLSPSFWIDAIKRYREQNPDNFRTESELLVLLHEKYVLPEEKKTKRKIAKVIMFFVVCFVGPYITKKLEFPEVNLIFSIVNLFVAYLLGVYMNKIEEVFIPLAGNDLLYDRMKRETCIEMIKQMRLNKVE